MVDSFILRPFLFQVVHKLLTRFYPLHMHYGPDPFGHSVHALGELPPDTTIGVCPFSLAITPTAALDALRCLLPTGLSYEVKDLWSGRQLICVYICLHWIDSTAVAARCVSLRPQLCVFSQMCVISSDVLKHAPYIASLPTPDKLRASVYFTPSELSAFAGTNLYGATTDRLATLREEWSECRLVLTEADGAWGAGLTWLV